MNIPRLKHLITILKNVPPENFDIKNWTCGTAACALGWAARDPEFNKQGLCMVTESGATYPGFDGEVGFTAGALFFDLPRSQSGRLFDGWNYPKMSLKDVTAQHVIERIKELLA